MIIDRVNLFKFELSACFCLAVMQLLSKDKTDPREILYNCDLVLPRLHYKWVRIFSFSLSFQVGHYLRNRDCISWLYKILHNITVSPINMLTNYRLLYCEIGVACATGPIKICYPPIRRKKIPGYNPSISSSRQKDMKSSKSLVKRRFVVRTMVYWLSWDCKLSLYKKKMKKYCL